ncbi:hypothetical protein F5X99DRAFT_430358 [Biscogniauxia marginata]|nr:hypothetical protein F5X99DRAFT_430358 [Biscogniauxia marginata]
MSLLEKLAPPLVVEPTKYHTHTVIFLHLFKQDTDEAEVRQKVLSEKRTKNGKILRKQYPSIRWVFPHAKLHPDLGNGQPDSDYWGNLTPEDKEALGMKTDIEIDYINNIIRKEAKRVGGTNKVFLGGIGIGCAAASNALKAFKPFRYDIADSLPKYEKLFVRSVFHNRSWARLADVQLAGFIGMQKYDAKPNNDVVDFWLSKKTYLRPTVHQTLLKNTPHTFIRGGYKYTNDKWDGHRIDMFSRFIGDLGVPFDPEAEADDEDNDGARAKKRLAEIKEAKKQALSNLDIAELSSGDLEDSDSSSDSSEGEEENESSAPISLLYAHLAATMSPHELEEGALDEAAAERQRELAALHEQRTARESSRPKQNITIREMREAKALRREERKFKRAQKWPAPKKPPPPKAGGLTWNEVDDEKFSYIDIGPKWDRIVQEQKQHTVRDVVEMKKFPYFDYGKKKEKEKIEEQLKKLQEGFANGIILADNQEETKKQKKKKDKFKKKVTPGEGTEEGEKGETNDGKPEVDPEEAKKKKKNHDINLPGAVERRERFLAELEVRRNTKNREIPAFEHRHGKGQKLGIIGQGPENTEDEEQQKGKKGKKDKKGKNPEKTPRAKAGRATS